MMADGYRDDTAQRSKYVSQEIARNKDVDNDFFS